MADHDMYVRRAEFNEWVERQARGGGGRLHALTEVPAGFESSPAECLAEDRPHMPADPGAEVVALENEWGRWWRCHLHQERAVWPAGLGERPPRPSVEQ
eukprot:3720631-Pyramimonas_sp.AAC.1